MKKGIEIRSGFWPLNQQKGFNFRYVNGTTNLTKSLSKKIFEKTLVLPSSIDLYTNDIKKIINTISEALKNG